MWIIGLGGAMFVLSLPNIYEARAQFYVDADSRLRIVVDELGMTPGVESRVFLVSQALKGRPKLEQVAEEAGLFESDNGEVDHDGVITSLMEKVQVETGHGTEGQNHFTIKYRHRDRDKAELVVRKLMDLFQEDMLTKKLEDLSPAEGFLDEQLEHYRALLSETEIALQDFKREHPGFVIDDAGGTFERLQRVRAEEKRLEYLYGIKRKTRDELRRQLGSVDPHAAPNGQNQAANALIPGATTRAAITKLEAQKANLLLSYTESHPDITAIEQQLIILKQQLRQELSTEVSGRSIDGAARASNPVYIQIQLNLSAANLELSEVQSQLSNARASVRELTAQLNTAPEIERKFIELTRDYTKYQVLYDDVLLKAERERIGRVGGQQDVVTFNVIEPPHSENDPVSPPRLVLLLGVFGVALGVAVALAFLMDQLKPTFGSEATLGKLGVPVLGSVAMFVTPETQARRRSDLLRFLTVTITFVAVYAVIFVGMDWGVEQIDKLVR